MSSLVWWRCSVSLLMWPPKHCQVPIGYNNKMARKHYVKDNDTKHISEKGSWKLAQLRDDPRQISRQKRHFQGQDIPLPFGDITRSEPPDKNWFNVFRWFQSRFEWQFWHSKSHVHQRFSVHEQFVNVHECSWTSHPFWYLSSNCYHTVQTWLQACFTCEKCTSDISSTWIVIYNYSCNAEA